MVRDHPGASSVGAESAQARAAVDQQLLIRYHRHGDRAARERLIQRLMPLARWLARRHATQAASHEDLVQVASLGLVKAVDGFDPDRGVAFSAYAVPVIAGELKRHLRDNTWSVKIPRPVKDLVIQTAKATTALSKELGRDPTVGELAEELDVEPHRVVQAIAARRAGQVVSLDAHRFGDDGETYADMVGSEDAGFDFDYAPALHSTLRALPARERVILHLRFVEDLSQAAIAERIGISQMHVSRLMRRALTRLQPAAERTAAA
jgi:RNA polymerase sigma-B factor